MERVYFRGHPFWVMENDVVGFPVGEDEVLLLNRFLIVPVEEMTSELMTSGFYCLGHEIEFIRSSADYTQSDWYRGVRNGLEEQ